MAMQREMTSATRTNKPLILAFIDVDHLKEINDANGHAAGDQMLLQVAETLRANLRPRDLLIRYGGDEFICAISGLEMADAAKWSGRVNAALATTSERGSVTVGFAELQTHDSLEDLVARADAALYRERQGRRPRA